MWQTVNHKSMLIYISWRKGLRACAVQCVYITFAFQSDERINVSVQMYLGITRRLYAERTYMCFVYNVHTLFSSMIL
jgi:hypothetical protein